jgi:hypothetical protein
MEFRKFQSLVELNLSGCFKFGCLPNLIVDLLQHKKFRLYNCHKLENLLMEFEKLQSLVGLNLFKCSELGCLPNSIMDLSKLKRF